MDMNTTSNRSAPLAAFASPLLVGQVSNRNGDNNNNNGDEDDEYSADWWSHATSFDNESQQLAFVSELVHDEDGGVNVYYMLVTSYIMPLFLFLQWTLELLDTDHQSSDTMTTLGWAVPVASTALFCHLSPLHHKASAGSVPVLLFPVVFLTVADALVLFHETLAAFGVMACGLLAMAARVTVVRYRTRVSQQEWTMAM